VDGWLVQGKHEGRADARPSNHENFAREIRFPLVRRRSFTPSLTHTEPCAFAPTTCQRYHGNVNQPVPRTGDNPASPVSGNTQILA
jgi:hypothetical protein